MKTKNILIAIFILLANLIYSQSNVEYKYITTSTDGTDYYGYIEKVATNGTTDIWVKSKIPLKDLEGKKIKGGGKKQL